MVWSGSVIAWLRGASSHDCVVVCGGRRARFNGEGLKALAAQNFELAEAQFLAASSACAAYTQRASTSTLFAQPMGGGAPPAVHRALSLHNLGIVYTKQKRLDSAKQVFLEAISLLSAFKLNDYQVLGNVYRELASIYDSEVALIRSRAFAECSATRCALCAVRCTALCAVWC
jgi:hypothetical protein